MYTTRLMTRTKRQNRLLVEWFWNLLETLTCSCGFSSTRPYESIQYTVKLCYNEKWWTRQNILLIQWPTERGEFSLVKKGDERRRWSGLKALLRLWSQYRGVVILPHFSRYYRGLILKCLYYSCKIVPLSLYMMFHCILYRPAMYSQGV